MKKSETVAATQRPEETEIVIATQRPEEKDESTGGLAMSVFSFYADDTMRYTILNCFAINYDP